MHRNGSTRTIREEAYALKHVFDDDRLEYVQLEEPSQRPNLPGHCTHLELSTGACHAHSGLVTHNLGSDHCDCLTLCGIDFAGHDAATRFIFREVQLAEPTAGTRAEEAYIVGNLHQGASNDVESTMSFDKRIMTSQGLKLRQGQRNGRPRTWLPALFGAVLNSRPVIFEISAATLTSKPFLVFKPCQGINGQTGGNGVEPTVPTAVPPCAKRLKRGMAALTRSIPLSIC